MKTKAAQKIFNKIKYKAYLLVFSCFRQSLDDLFRQNISLKFEPDVIKLDVKTPCINFLKC